MLLQPSVSFYDLGWKGRSRKYLSNERVWVQRDRCDELLQCLGALLYRLGRLCIFLSDIFSECPCIYRCEHNGSDENHHQNRANRAECVFPLPLLTPLSEMGG